MCAVCYFQVTSGISLNFCKNMLLTCLSFRLGSSLGFDLWLEIATKGNKKISFRRLRASRDRHECRFCVMCQLLKGIPSGAYDKGLLRK